ncbi:uncharacterized protein [Coffea arabica]|uniref:RNase H type-1 domain-containing protein n=1 Tax=Coffea arabica TaxID=13443 RepID=A0ABM4X8D0_COFAR
MERAGRGILARSNNGSVVSAWVGAEQNCSDPIVEEASAIRRALVKAKLKGWNRIEIQCDCKVVVDKIMEENNQDARIGTIVEDIMNMKEDFCTCSFSFREREGNYVSHELAKFALNLVTDIQWKDSVPAWLTSLARRHMGAVAPIL